MTRRTKDSRPLFPAALLPCAFVLGAGVILVLAGSPSARSPSRVVREYLQEVLAEKRKVGRDHVVAPRLLELRARMVDLGPKALPELEKQFLALRPEDRWFLLREPKWDSSYWPIFSAEAGEFLAGQLQALPGPAQENAIMLIARCKYKPALSLIRKRYQQSLSPQSPWRSHWHGIALCLLGDYRHVPRWTATLLDAKCDLAVGEWTVCEFVLPAQIGWKMIGPVNNFYARFAREYKQSGYSGVLTPRILGWMILSGLLTPEQRRGIDDPNAYWERWMRSRKGRKAQVDSWIWCGRNAIYYKRYQTAQKCFEEALALAPGNVQARVDLSCALGRLRKYRQGAAEAERALEAHPNHVHGLRCLAMNYCGLGQFEKAIQRLNNALKQKKDDPSLLRIVAVIYTARAREHSRAGEYGEAIKDCTKAIELDPKYPEAHTYRAQAHAATRSYDKAIVDYTKALKLDPRLPAAYNNLAWLYVTSDDPKYRRPKEGLRLALKAVELGGTMYHFGTLACAYAENGDFTKAVQMTQKALHLCKDRKRATEYRHWIEGFKQGKTYLQQKRGKQHREKDEKKGVTGRGKRGRESVFVDIGRIGGEQGGMPRRPRYASGPVVFGVVNRPAGCLPVGRAGRPAGGGCGVVRQRGDWGQVFILHFWPGGMLRRCLPSPASTVGLAERVGTNGGRSRARREACALGVPGGPSVPAAAPGSTSNDTP